MFWYLNSWLSLSYQFWEQNNLNSFLSQYFSKEKVKHTVSKAKQAKKMYCNFTLFMSKKSETTSFYYFSQGFQKLKKFGHWTLGSGGKKTLNGVNKWRRKNLKKKIFGRDHFTPFLGQSCRTGTMRDGGTLQKYFLKPKNFIFFRFRSIYLRYNS